MDTSSPARLYATLVGGVLVVAGLIGFFYDSSFDTGDSLRADEVLGLLAVNGWHNLVHIATGALGLALANSRAREYALGLGVVYLLVALLGFIEFGSGDGAENILQLIPVNAEDNWFHLVLGVLGVGAGLSTPASPQPSRAPA